MTKNDLEHLIVTHDSGVMVITLNRPQSMNTINTTTIRELLQSLNSAKTDDRVRAVLLRATGRAFCAGGDMSDQKDADFSQLSFWVKGFVASMSEVYLSMLNMQKPVVCAVNGIAAGGGFALPLASDIVIASEAAKFSVVFARTGLGVEAGVGYLLPRTVGLHKAKELIFFADTIDASEADRIGLVNKVVPADRLDGESLDVARRLASGPTKALGLSKAIVHRGLDMDLASSVEMESWCQALCVQTEDFVEGRMAFLDKRAPNFKGK